MAKELKKVAIANRGEVAVRVIRAAKELGLKTVLLHSTEDTGGLAYRLADQAICIGEGAASTSYLDHQKVLQGALASGAGALHPGFGFLSENAEFAKAVTDSGIHFIGPSAKCIGLFGDKVAAKKQAMASKVPVIEGQFVDKPSDVNIESLDFPVLVKAAMGGGGRGLRIAQTKEDLKSAMEAASQEAKSFFGSGKIFLEKYLTAPKHVEVQIFGDLDGKVYSLGVRECSVQRKYQKVIEEAGTVYLPFQILDEMQKCACKLAQDAGYQSAGTIEFLIEDDKFYFMEMNTRLQVEHPVSEFVTGVDLVKAQLRLAMGLSPNWSAEDLTPRGHSIECRIYAEDPYMNGMPSTGQIKALHLPYGPGRRFDFGYEVGDKIGTFYDSMIGKIIVYDETRPRALNKMLKALDETIIFGVKTNIPFLKQIINHVDFVDGHFKNTFLAQHFPEGLLKPSSLGAEDKVYKQLSKKIAVAGKSGKTAQANSTLSSFWEAQ